MSYRLKDFGSYRAGGRVATVEGRPLSEIRFTATTSYPYDPNGDFPVEAAYVQYYRPEADAGAPPVVLLHGGGMCGTMWETTPDGRPGWLQLLVAAGHEVHVIDNVERGRAGWMPNLWEGAPVLRSLQEAWGLFRLGRPEDFVARHPFPGQQFPVEALEVFGQSFVPRWTSTAEAQVAALSAVLARLGRAILICHSQGGEIAFRAAALAPGRIARLIAIEPSGLPQAEADTVAALAPVPVTIVHGDYMDSAPVWRMLTGRWREFAAAHRAAGGEAGMLDLAAVAPGASHFPMLDRASPAYLEAVLQAAGLAPGG